MNEKWWRLIVAGMAALFFALPAGSRAESKENGKGDVVRLADSFGTVSVYPPYIADDLGFFAEEGIKAEFVGVVPPPQLVAAVIAGRLDVGGAHVNRTISGINAGAKIKAVVAATETTREQPHMVFVVPANSPIKSPRDLIGKRVAIMAYGGCNEYTPYEWLRKNGVASPKGKLTIVVVPPGKEIDAVKHGDADVAGAHINPADLAKKGNDLRILFTDYDVWGTQGGATPQYFSEKFIKEKPDVVRRFVRALAKTNNWINANPEKAKIVFAKRAKVDPAQVSVNHYAPDGIIKDDSVKLWISLLTDYGEVKPGIRTGEIFTNAFNQPIERKKKEKKGKTAKVKGNDTGLISELTK
ncbi:MAG: ABC transporter substrate-binding protein [Geobacter sp.]|nr:ABC transporter substrate-binding protein [Geobacter sp.]